MLRQNATLITKCTRRFNTPIFAIVARTQVVPRLTRVHVLLGGCLVIRALGAETNFCLAIRQDSLWQLHCVSFSNPFILFFVYCQRLAQLQQRGLDGHKFLKIAAPETVTSHMVMHEDHNMKWASQGNLMILYVIVLSISFVFALRPFALFFLPQPFVLSTLLYCSFYLPTSPPPPPPPPPPSLVWRKSKGSGDTATLQPESGTSQSAHTSNHKLEMADKGWSGCCEVL